MTSKGLTDIYGVSNACANIASNILKNQRKNVEIFIKTSNWKWSTNNPQKSSPNYDGKKFVIIEEEKGKNKTDITNVDDNLDHSSVDNIDNDVSSDKEVKYIYIYIINYEFFQIYTFTLKVE